MRAVVYEADFRCRKREGVFIDAALVPFEDYSDFDGLMKDGFRATYYRDSLIVYDPTGLLADVQGKLRAAFMQPKWVAVRVFPSLAQGRKGVKGLQDTVAAALPLGICAETGRVTAALLRAGVAPSSLGQFTQLEKVHPEIAERMATLHGSRDMGAQGAGALVPFYGRIAELVDLSPFGGLLLEHADHKLIRMAVDGHQREGVRFLWWSWCFVPSREKATPAVREKADALAGEWLRAIGWVGEAVLAEKVKLAASILGEVEALAADLPAMKQATP